jgi:predicted phosphodiesterase
MSHRTLIVATVAVTALLLVATRAHAGTLPVIYDGVSGYAHINATAGFLGGAAKVQTLVGLAPSNHGTTLDGLFNFAHQFKGASALVGALCPAWRIRRHRSAASCFRSSAGSPRSKLIATYRLHYACGVVNVLALYDIHANVDALEAVLADPRAADPDLVVVGGDAVPGPFGRAALARLDALSHDVKWVRGNGEREVSTALDDPAPADDDMAARTAAITAIEIGVDQARALGELPLTVELDGVLYCHASPRRDDEMLTRLSPPERYERALSEVGAGLVVAGHTHQHDDRTVAGVRFINAGSVGLPYEGDGSARWLWVADGVPELRHTAYDSVRAGERMLAAGWPDEVSIRASLIQPVEPIVITELFEQRAG